MVYGNSVLFCDLFAHLFGFEVISGSGSNCSAVEL